jgi:hypothetical protein
MAAKRYSHPSPDHKKKVVELLSSQGEEQKEGKKSNSSADLLPRSLPDKNSNRVN